MSGIEVHGTVVAGFEAVREEFADAVSPEDGAQLAVYLHGRPVVDLWSGDAVTGDSLTGVYSSTKGAATVAVALLVQDGVLDLDEPVARHWPEFAAAGKDRITLRDVLTHRSGVIGVDGGFTADELADDRLIARRLAGQRPFWRPGAAHGYGGFVTFAMVAEVVRRVTGRSLQEHFEQRVRAPLGLDLYLGLPEALEDRYREVRPGSAGPAELAAFRAALPGPHGLTGIGYGLDSTPPLDQVAFLNTRRVRALGQASAGGVGNARALAGLYAAAVFGLDGREPLLDADTVGEFAMPHSTGRDLVTGDAGQYALGFQAKGLRYPFLSAKAFGHNGSAGSESFADPIAGIAFGYTRRRFSPTWSYPEHDRLAAAVHRAATARRASPNRKSTQEIGKDRSTMTTTQDALRSRLPNPAALVPELGQIAGAMFQAVGNGSVPPATISLVQLRAGQVVGNTYLTTLHTGNLRKAGESEERITAVASWRDAPHFTAAERAALALVEAVLTPDPHGERVSDELYARASEHYDDKALTTLTLAIGQVCFFIPLALIGKPLPGVAPAAQWRD